jgi:hypothetical protein
MTTTPPTRDATPAPVDRDAVLDPMRRSKASREQLDQARLALPDPVNMARDDARGPPHLRRPRSRSQTGMTANPRHTPRSDPVASLASRIRQPVEQSQPRCATSQTRPRMITCSNPVNILACSGPGHYRRNHDRQCRNNMGI